MVAKNEHGVKHKEIIHYQTTEHGKKKYACTDAYTASKATKDLSAVVCKHCQRALMKAGKKTKK